MEKRKLAMSDVHGQYQSMVTLLEVANFNPEKDQLVLVGDLIDRGPHSVEVLKYAKQLQERYPENVFVVLGNHEIMMRQYVFGMKSNMWLRYGGQAVIQELKTAFQTTTERVQHLVWVANLPLYHQDEEHFYVHAGIDVNKPATEQHEMSTFTELNWMYSVPSKALKQAIGDRIMVHGHTPYSAVYRAGNNFISCDTGASVWENGKLSLVDLSNNLYYCNDLKSPEVRTLRIEELEIVDRIEKARGK
ncbi:metallophosphoesterase family protein [Neobacillus sp. PS3-40]|uniref:metallophosphoesterase family protein n=1 Tax=Neobacillus sp. PS3-40 TaxID=3070679 RepID=UPI0027DF34F2|nr:metallophosphoesterase family protein [Neobacillus sp. PS3-40]WML45406.1 metallophosphoesterase family protein [Neobacillus sp. PS3-40]